MHENTNKPSTAVRYKYLSLILIIIFLLGITLFFIFGVSISDKPLIHILDLRKDSVSTKLINELKIKGITGKFIADSADIKNTFATHKAKLILVICENPIASVLSTKLYKNSYENISPDALFVVMIETIQDFSVRNHLVDNILLSEI